MARVYNRSTLFLLKLAKNMGQRTPEERKEALKQYPEHVADLIEKTIYLTKIVKRGK